MTCIVGIAQNNTVTIGGDSAGVGGYSIQLRADTKVFRNQNYVMGFTTSFRMGQLLRYGTLPPAPTAEQNWDLDRFMATTFVDAVRKVLEAGGWLKSSSGVEEGGTFLVGARGMLYEVHGDFQVGRTLDGYSAVGCGEDLALGALHATVGSDLTTRERVELALRAAEHHSAGVAAPFAFEALP
jgi:ATP-dependent protease HslVU (ClpYQ) peptidase subunit